MSFEETDRNSVRESTRGHAQTGSRRPLRPLPTMRLPRLTVDSIDPAAPHAGIANPIVVPNEAENRTRFQPNRPF